MEDKQLADTTAKMRRYIDLTPITRSQKTAYSFNMNEMLAFIWMLETKGPYAAFMLAFEFGRAKGLRMGARKEAAHE